MVKSRHGTFPYPGDDLRNNGEHSYYTAAFVIPDSPLMNYKMCRMLASALALLLAVGCVREKPPAPPKSPPPATRTQEPLTKKDIAGKPRGARQGITPGALEAEGPPPSAPPKRNAPKPEKGTPSESSAKPR